MAYLSAPKWKERTMFIIFTPTFQITSFQIHRLSKDQDSKQRLYCSTGIHHLLTCHGRPRVHTLAFPQLSGSKPQPPQPFIARFSRLRPLSRSALLYYLDNTSHLRKRALVTQTIQCMAHSQIALETLGPSSIQAGAMLSIPDACCESESRAFFPPFCCFFLAHLLI